MNARRQASRAFAAAAALVLSGCFLLGGDSFFLGQGGGGGEDFPNTVQTLSKATAQDVASASNLGEVANLQIPELPDLSVFTNLQIEPIGLSKGLAKRALAKRAAEGECDTSYYEYTQAEIVLFHRGRKIVCDEDSSRVRRDTLQFWIRTLPTEGDSAAVAQRILDSAVLIEAWGVVAYKTESRTQSYHAWNFDSTGTLDHARYVTTSTEGATRTVQRVYLYGRDGAYQAEGAPPSYYELLKTSGVDTLDWQRMTDADGDSAFWDRNAKENAKGVVLFSRKAKQPSEAPATARLTQAMRSEIHHAPGKPDSMVTLWYFDQRTLTGGASAAFSFRGAAADSILRGGDTAIITLDTAYVATDSMINFRANYRMVLGSSPTDNAARRLAAFSVDKSARRGNLRESRTRFIPAEPLPMNQPFLGNMSAQSLEADGDSLYTDGTIEAETLRLTLRVVSKGTTKVYRLVLDRDGNEKEPTVEITKTVGQGGSSRLDTARAIQSPARADSARQADTVKAVQSPSRAP